MLIVYRNKVLHDHGRIELGIEVLKELIEVFAASPYMDEDNYVETLIELQEIFYYYVAYVQGGLTYSHVKNAICSAVDALMKQGLM